MMDTEYFVTARDRCSKCSGSRYVEHFLWRQLRDEHTTDELLAWSNEQLSKWFADRGYCDIAHSDIPNEEEICWVCDGDGTTTRTVILRDALEALGVRPSMGVEEIAPIAWRLDELERKQLLDHRTMHATFNDHLALLGALNERVTQLEERLAVLEEEGATPVMTTEQYIALRLRSERQ